jgi:ADP-heptose:LPS heptosyltransferase
VRRRYREASELVLAAPASLAPLVARIGAVDRLLPVPPAIRTPPGPLPAAAGRPELAINLHGSGPQSTVALRDLGPTALWAYRVPDGPPWRDEEHEVERWCRLVAWYGCDADPTDLYLSGRLSGSIGGPISGTVSGTVSGPVSGAVSGTGEARGGPVLVHPGTAEVERRWPAERFAAVARALADRGYAVRVTAGPGERPLAASVVAQAGLPAAAIADSIDLDALTDLVAASPLVVCADTGIAHLATACRTRSVVIFGPQPPSRWGPPANGRHRVLWSPSPRDRTAPGRPHPSVLRVDPVDVLAAAEELLRVAGGTPS